MKYEPLVTAVIPTRNRPALVERAVRSVLTQTYPSVECVVVIDGPDEETVRTLATMSDPRLRVVALAENVGGCEARNIGAREARGEWVGLLDDDDEWLPEKLAVQMAAAESAGVPVTMVVSKFLDRGGDADLVRPTQFPKKGQPISEFLWCEVSMLGGIVGFPQTSTWLVRRDFLLEVPFTRGLKALQDLDWLLRGYPHPRMHLVTVQQPLAIFHNDHARVRVTKRIDWEFIHSWGMANRALFTPKAFGYFLTVYCVNPAAQQRAAWEDIRALLTDISTFGMVDLKLSFMLLTYLLAYPCLSRVLSRRQQSTLLYRFKAVLRRATGRNGHLVGGRPHI